MSKVPAANAVSGRYSGGTGDRNRVRQRVQEPGGARPRCTRDMETAATWVAPIATTLAAIMVAANLGSRFTGWGFVVFTVGSLAWVVIGMTTGQPNLLWQNVFLCVVNVVGIWRWLGIRARYEKGAGVATDASARIFRRHR